MIKILKKKRYQELLSIEKAFNNTNIDCASYEELQLLYKQKHSELADISKRIILVERIHSNIISNARKSRSNPNK